MNNRKIKKIRGKDNKGKCRVVCEKCGEVAGGMSQPVAERLMAELVLSDAHFGHLMDVKCSQ